MTTKSDRLHGVFERRSFKCEEFELRAKSDTLLEFNGYASVFDKPYEMYGGPDNGGWNERVNRRSLDETLKRNADVVFLVNHEGLPIARTKSKTLDLHPDRVGLHAHADLDRRDPDVQRLEVKAERGDMDEMSFAFRTMNDDWNDAQTERELLELNMDKGDVSVVNFGANPHTSFGVRAAINAITADNAVELRSLDPADIRSAHKILGRLLIEDDELPPEPPSTDLPSEGRRLSVAHARRLLQLSA